MMVILRRNHVVMFLFSCCFLVASFGVYLFALHPNLKEWQRQGIVVSSVDTNEKAIRNRLENR
jgi:capsular polysaccharide biosynthesis protein